MQTITKVQEELANVKIGQESLRKQLLTKTVIIYCIEDQADELYLAALIGLTNLKIDFAQRMEA